MPFKLDHIIIAVGDLDQAIAEYQALGFNAFYGGKHASGTTQNALVCFADGSYLELLAPTGEPRTDMNAADFSGLLQQGKGLAGYALLSDDFDADSAALRAKGIDVGEVKIGSRLRPDKVELRWQTALIDGGMSPFLIQDITPRNLRVPDDEAVTRHHNGSLSLQDLARVIPNLNLNQIEQALKRLDAATLD